MSTPTLLLLGEKSEVHRSARIRARVSALQPSIDTEVIAGAGHSLPVDQAGRVAERLDAFLAGAP